MPFQYAIKEFVPGEGIHPSQASRWNSETEYHPVPKHVAEANPEMGVVAIFNNNGEKVSDWVRLDTETVESAFKKKSPASPRKDRLGSEISVRDFVVYCEFDGTSLHVGQVAGFTDKNVRVITYKYLQSRVKMVEPEKVTVIHSSIISE